MNTPQGTYYLITIKAYEIQNDAQGSKCWIQRNCAHSRGNSLAKAIIASRRRRTSYRIAQRRLDARVVGNVFAGAVVESQHFKTPGD
jgi:hypothetical protein